MTEHEDALQACREWLAQIVDIDCRSGAYDEADILEAIEEIIGIELGEPDPALFAELAAVVRTGLEAQAAIEKTWSERTVNDAIDSAFEALTARGILALQHLGNTTQEGWERAEARKAESPGCRGCVYYHRQDLERGVKGEGLFLAFGSFDQEGDAAAIAIGREVVHVLTHYSVEVTWSGSPRARMTIAPFTWRKRLVTKAPPGPDAPGPVPRPPPPPALCPLCKGRGWIAQTDPTHFPDLCVCKGGKPVPATSAPPVPSGPSAPLTPPSPSASLALDSSTITTSTTDPPPSSSSATRSPSESSAPLPTGTLSVPSVARLALPVVIAGILLYAWKRPPISWILLFVAVALVPAMVRARRRRS